MDLDIALHQISVPRLFFFLISTISQVRLWNFGGNRVAGAGCTTDLPLVLTVPLEYLGEFKLATPLEAATEIQISGLGFGEGSTLPE